MGWLWTEIEPARVRTRGRYWRTVRARVSCDRCGAEAWRPVNSVRTSNRRRWNGDGAEPTTFCSRQCANSLYHPKRSEKFVYEDGSRRCSCCRITKTREEFRDNSTKPKGESRCLECVAKLAKLARERRRAELLQRGACTRCAKRLADAGNVCTECWFYLASKNTQMGVRPAVNVLIEIWNDQGGKCPLTGDHLVMGQYTTSLDHIVPRSRGGGNERANLRWVTYEANTAKSDMTDDELVAFCRRVVATADSRKVRRKEKCQTQPTLFLVEDKAKAS